MFSANAKILAKAFLKEARERELHVSTAESCTGGLIIGALTAIPGSSDVVDRGFIVYTNAAKSDLLGVPKLIIRKYGAVSEEVARAMAEGALLNSDAQMSVSCTGIAGPSGGSPEKPVGLVHIAAARENETTLHEECHFGDVGRDAIRMRSVEAALKLLLQLV